MFTTPKVKHKTTAIFLATVYGLIAGLILHQLPKDGWVNTYITEGLLYMGGELFIASIKMLVIPLVFTSLVCSIASFESTKRLGVLSIKTFCLFTITTLTATIIGLVFASIFGVGQGVTLPDNIEVIPTTISSPSLIDALIGIVPANPILAMTEGNILQIIFFAILIGIGVKQLPEKEQRILHFFQDFQKIMLYLFSLVIKIAPYGIFCLITSVFATTGLSVLGSLFKYVLVMLLALAAHLSLLLLVLLSIMSQLSPYIFLKKMRSTLLFAFSTDSSLATIPMTLNTLVNKLGVDQRIAAFITPLGATLHTNGAPIFLTIATVFAANLFGIAFTLSDYCVIILTILLASVATPGIPGAAIVSVTLVAQQMGLPLEGIALIIGIDRLLGMLRTTLNVAVDAVSACWIAKSEHALDREIFYDSGQSDIASVTEITPEKQTQILEN